MTVLSPPATIRAASYWNDTGIIIEAGRRYDFFATGNWVDLVVRSGPDGNPAPGWSQRLLQRQLRAQGQPYFRLIGALDRDPASMFPIGAALTGWEAPRGGMLTCFANDVPGFYWNNSGSVILMVTPADLAFDPQP